MADQLTMHYDSILRPQGSRLISLWEIVSEYERGIITSPIHQRGGDWPNDKGKDYITRMRRGDCMPGDFETYQLPTDDRMRLNDGGNRVRLLQRYKIDPGKHGDDVGKAEQFLRRCVVCINHHIYSTPTQALWDFIYVNMGTGMSPYEQCRGAILYTHGDNELSARWFLKVLDDLHIAMRVCATRIVVNPHEGKEAMNKHKRDDLGLWLRFLSADISISNYRSSRGRLRSLSEQDFIEGTIIEARLQKILKKMTQDEISHSIHLFVDCMERETATLLEMWKKACQDIPLGLRTGAYRWLLSVAIWKRNTQVASPIWCDFLLRFFANTRGSPTVKDPDPAPGKIDTAIALSDLTRLSKVCDYIGSDLYHKSTEHRKRSSVPIPPGYDRSHILPFATDGNGPTIIEPAAINRSRGARPIPPDSNVTLT